MTPGATTALNRKQLWSFLGLVGYYRRFIPHFASIVSSLTDMLRKGKKFVWSDKADVAFVEIKSRLASRPILRPPDFRFPFCIGVDAFCVAIEALYFTYFARRSLTADWHKFCQISTKHQGV